MCRCECACMCACEHVKNSRYICSHCQHLIKTNTVWSAFEGRQYFRFIIVRLKKKNKYPDFLIFGIQFFSWHIKFQSLFAWTSVNNYREPTVVVLCKYFFTVNFDRLHICYRKICTQIMTKSAFALENRLLAVKVIQFPYRDLMIFWKIAVHALTHSARGAFKHCESKQI